MVATRRSAWCGAACGPRCRRHGVGVGGWVGDGGGELTTSLAGCREAGRQLQSERGAGSPTRARAAAGSAGAARGGGDTGQAERATAPRGSLAL